MYLSWGTWHITRQLHKSRVQVFYTGGLQKVHGIWHLHFRPRPSKALHRVVCQPGFPSLGDVGGAAGLCLGLPTP